VDGYGAEPYAPGGEQPLALPIELPRKAGTNDISRSRSPARARRVHSPARRGTTLAMTKFRIGLALGFGAGYYLGTKAGRQRYAELNRLIGRLRKTDVVGKARAVIDLGRERAHVHDAETPLVDLSAGSYRYN